MKKSILLLTILLSLSSCNKVDFEAIKQEINNIINYHKINSITKFTRQYISVSKDASKERTTSRTYKLSLDDCYYCSVQSFEIKWVYYLDGYVYDVTIDKTFSFVTGKDVMTHSIKPISESFVDYLANTDIVDYCEEVKFLSYDLLLNNVLSLIDSGEVENYYKFELDNDIFRIKSDAENDGSKISSCIEYKNNIVSKTTYTIQNVNYDFEVNNIMMLDCEIVYPNLDESTLIE